MSNLIPQRLDLQRDKQLSILWADGQTSVYTIDRLRTLCPCAMCKDVRDQKVPQKRSLHILPGNFAEAIKVLSAEMVGNYALKLEFSDGHGSGIYSFEYLRSIDPNLK